MGTTVLVDARNVARSRWPNLSEVELIDRAGAWAASRNASVVLVFDGRLGAERCGEDGADTGEPGTRRAYVRVVETHGGSADDWLAQEADRLRANGVAYWLVTSDRELRDRAGRGAERVIGGGSFLRELGVDGGATG
jgi:hypothetical protein